MLSILDITNVILTVVGLMLFIFGCVVVWQTDVTSASINFVKFLKFDLSEHILMNTNFLLDKRLMVVMKNVNLFARNQQDCTLSFSKL